MPEQVIVFRAPNPTNGPAGSHLASTVSEGGLDQLPALREKWIRAFGEYGVSPRDVEYKVYDVGAKSWPVYDPNDTGWRPVLDATL